jgi:PPOX class probable F420-dependent enzyme
MASLTAAQQQFLANPWVAVVTTLRADGSPHSTVVWVENEDGDLSFNTAVGRAKERHLRQNPRLSLLVLNPENPMQWLAVTGSGTIGTDDAEPQMDRLAKKYLGEDVYPWRSPDEERVKVRIAIDRVDASGLDG